MAHVYRLRNNGYVILFLIRSIQPYDMYKTGVSRGNSGLMLPLQKRPQAFISKHSISVPFPFPCKATRKHQLFQKGHQQFSTALRVRINIRYLVVTVVIEFANGRHGPFYIRHGRSIGWYYKCMWPKLDAYMCPASSPAEGVRILTTMTIIIFKDLGNRLF